MPSSIRLRLIGTSVLIVIVAIAIVSFLSYRFARGFMLDDLNVQLSQIATAEATRLGEWTAHEKRVVAAIVPSASASDPTVALSQAHDAGSLDAGDALWSQGCPASTRRRHFAGDRA